MNVNAMHISELLERLLLPSVAFAPSMQLQNPELWLGVLANPFSCSVACLLLLRSLSVATMTCPCVPKTTINIETQSKSGRYLYDR
ncbi:RGS domain-containing protein [Anopheles sinensis]|uniref:RGS domain-containing protein n=1 Tax=Anopheles sinensis TaxID=74873 RepID=A0A084VEU8_ANOSI|nr:RGS domain-containing protein [Anopheles sinensis]